MGWLNIPTWYLFLFYVLKTKPYLKQKKNINYIPLLQKKINNKTIREKNIFIQLCLGFFNISVGKTIMIPSHMRV